ncbi:hypothetical protein SAMD00019534_123490 [Acytostelium subglobosum LB1]|uniref:hypothetical protein n=1 Tax=Acytostelium subglobosum LB1 TaxID=1410327 RepID=UPI000644A907|nr:hypothetical protein SAMD00019534_123490 [Acytostelium subglobosum LB1]GAM29173.1 hypothetical protein SAMD00019534_123490 [Acytostelium subglobosum LB1]|eukprot:XP_012747864.1 hypothetical protein SAMD00019534_123490 [Acytostelium subglobosum LB1]
MTLLKAISSMNFSNNTRSMTTVGSTSTASIMQGSNSTAGLLDLDANVVAHLNLLGICLDANVNANVHA